MSVWTFDSVSQETIELGRTRTPVDRSVIIDTRLGISLGPFFGARCPSHFGA